jgi:hypothetical protein
MTVVPVLAVKKRRKKHGVKRYVKDDVEVSVASKPAVCDPAVDLDSKYGSVSVLGALVQYSDSD